MNPDQSTSAAESSKLAHADVARVAHQLWEDAGCPDGHAEEHWDQARRLLVQAGASNTPATGSLADAGS